MEIERPVARVAAPRRWSAESLLAQHADYYTKCSSYDAKYRQHTAGILSNKHKRMGTLIAHHVCDIEASSLGKFLAIYSG